MSSISIGGSDQSLFQFYQQVSNNTAAPPAPTVTPSAQPSTSAPTDPQTTQAAPQHHHAHGGLFKKIESAVTTALQAAQADPSADPNKVVQDAIAKVFQDNGQNPPAGVTDSAGVKPADPDDASTQTDPSSARQAFFQTLQSFGVDASQFHSDFLAAIKNAQSGDSDTSSLFKSFPPGSTLDTTA